ncbi:hypothetical protein COM49_22195 [Bacillus pseudomycoides]|nr:hypothetical protein COM49_22195 [Bacillus pseudomycoides]PHG19669.1 hypothetical protein COI47_18355 [Bacillus pseudomycoides]
MKNKFTLPPFKKVIWVFIISITMYIYLSNNPPVTQKGYWIAISTPLIGIIVSLIFGSIHITKKIKY